MKKRTINVMTITMSAMFIALGVVLNYIRIPLSNVTEITLTGLPIAASAYMFGPWIGFATGALIDVIGFVIAPKGVYFPGFTISTGLIGMIYGLLLYCNRWKKRGDSASLLRNGNKGLAVRIVLAHFLKTVFISLMLNCFWLSMFYGMEYKVVFIASLPKELINFPIEAFLIYTVINLIKRLRPAESVQHYDE